MVRPAVGRGGLGQAPPVNLLSADSRIGREIEIVVPWPGSLVISSVPPARCARSRMPAIPRCSPAAAASSAPAEIPYRHPPRAASGNGARRRASPRPCEVPSWFTALSTASRPTRSAVVSIASGSRRRSPWTANAGSADESAIAWRAAVSRASARSRPSSSTAAHVPDHVPRVAERGVGGCEHVLQCRRALLRTLHEPALDRPELQRDAGESLQQRVVQLLGDPCALGERRLIAQPQPPATWRMWARYASQDQAASAATQTARNQRVCVKAGGIVNCKAAPVPFHTPSSFAAITRKR